MREVTYKTRKGEETHQILTPEEARDRQLHFFEDYKMCGGKGDLILTDDGFVVEILAYGKSKKNGKRWIRTCIGTFAIDSPTPYVDTEPKESRFTFGGNIRKQSHVKFAIEWNAFAEYLVRGYKPVDAYRMVYPNAKSKRYCHEKALVLMQRREVRKIVAAKLDDVFAELEIDDKWLIKRYQELAKHADRDSVSLQAVNALAEIKGIKGSNKIETSVKIFGGIPQAELQSAEESATRVFPEEPKELVEGVKDDSSDDDGEDITLEDSIF